jgi:uncharacterized membrane protein YphA (DoxX/SURF4 family)
MFTAGMSKLFDGALPAIIGPVWLTDELSKYGLEYLSQFVAWSQVVIGLLLMTQRFATLGAIMLMPMLLNIFIVMLSLGIHYYQPHSVNSAINTAIIISVLLVINLMLLIYDYHKLKFIFCESDEYLRSRKVRRKNGLADYLVISGIAVTLAGAVLFSQNQLVAYLMVAAGIIFCSLPLLTRRRKKFTMRMAS